MVNSRLYEISEGEMLKRQVNNALVIIAVTIVGLSTLAALVCLMPAIVVLYLIPEQRRLTNSK
jgi:hypothetical protein